MTNRIRRSESRRLPKRGSGILERVPRLAGVVSVSLSAASALVLGVGTPSAVADDCPNAGYRDGPSAGLPDCRAFEQVSPVNKRGNSVKGFASPLPGPGWSSDAGGTLLYNVALGPNSDNAARGFNYPLVAERGDKGWDNRPAVNGPAPQGAADGAYSTMYFQIPSEDRKDLLFSTGSPFTADNPYNAPGGNGSVNLGRGSAVDWLSKPTGAGASPAPGTSDLRREIFMTAGASKDLSTSYFMTRATLTPEDDASGRVPLSSWGLYRWTNGQLSNAAILPPTLADPQGTIDPGGAVAAGLEPGSDGVGVYNASISTQYSYAHSVSPDGSGVLFVSPDPKAMTGRPSQLYLARSGQATVQISQRTDTHAPPPGTTGVQVAGGLNSIPASGNDASNAAVYAVASRDQQVVLFSTTDALTNDAPAGRSVVKTYRYVVADGSLEYLPELDRSNEASTPGTYLDSTDGMVFNLSDDGSRMLYRTEAGELRLWRDGLPTVTLSTDVGPTARQDGGISESQFSQDGHTLILMSRVPLDGEADHPPSTSGNAPSQVYRYSDGDARPNCVSCPPPSAAARGAAAYTLQGIDNGFGTVGGGLLGMESARGMSRDGERVFFTTESSLSPNDNNAVADVYEWRKQDPVPRLLSSGTAASKGDYLVDVSATGSDVFFISAQNLVNADTDDVYDVYDARVDGGLPDPPTDVVGCVGDACQPPPSRGPTTLDPVSPTLAPPTIGAQDVPTGSAAPKALRISRKSGNGRELVLGVVAPGAGKLRVSGPGLATVSRATKRSATYTLKPKLSAKSRRTLAAKGRLKVRVSVRFTPTKGKAVTKTATLTIKRVKSTSRKAR